MTLTNAILYAVPCPHCSYNTMQTVHWLTTQNNMPCGMCGGTINLESGEIATIIQGLAQFCSSAGTPFSKRD